jgi:hypothetical protein
MADAKDQAFLKRLSQALLVRSEARVSKFTLHIEAFRGYIQQPRAKDDLTMPG